MEESFLNILRVSLFQTLQQNFVKFEMRVTRLLGKTKMVLPLLLAIISF